MQGQHLYEYAVIRAVPRVEREEFVNVGVILYCSSRKFLSVKYDETLSRVVALGNPQCVEPIRHSLETFVRICAGGRGSGTIGQLTVAERFRWLTATRSTMVQSSKVHPGFCTNPSETLELLYQKFVAPLPIE
jgi:hypothetical protein